MSIPATKKRLGESFVIAFPVAPQMVQVWEEKDLEQVRTDTGTQVAPVSTKKFLDLPATSSCTLDFSPMMVICDRWAGWGGPLQSC